MRHALINLEPTEENLRVVRRYLPSNYSAEGDGDKILVSGEDSHGWTLDQYVLPRLASGNIWGREVRL